MYIAADCCLQRDTVSVIVSVLLCSTLFSKSTVQIVQILYKLYSLQLIRTYSNFTQVLLHVQLHNSTAHLLEKCPTQCTITVQSVQSATKMYIQ